MLRQYILLENLVATTHQTLRRRRDETGATAVEYGLMVALIAVAIIGAVWLVGDDLNALFADVSASL